MHAVRQYLIVGHNCWKITYAAWLNFVKFISNIDKSYLHDKICIIYIIVVILAYENERCQIFANSLMAKFEMWQNQGKNRMIDSTKYDSPTIQQILKFYINFMENLRAPATF